MPSAATSNKDFPDRSTFPDACDLDFPSSHGRRAGRPWRLHPDGRGASLRQGLTLAIARARSAAREMLRSSYVASGGDSGIGRAPTGPHSILQIGADGTARCRMFDNWPRRVLFAVDNPIDCEATIRTGLTTVPREDLEVHLLWVAKRPNWSGRSLNRSLVLENLKHSRQRAAKHLELMVKQLEQEGYRASWEADEVDEPRASRIGRAARAADADLILVPNTLEPVFGVGKWLPLQKSLNNINCPIVTIGPGPQIAVLHGAEVPVAETTAQGLERGIPPPRTSKRPDSPSTAKLSSRSRNS